MDYPSQYLIRKEKKKIRNCPIPSLITCFLTKKLSTHLILYYSMILASTLLGFYISKKTKKKEKNLS